MLTGGVENLWWSEWERKGEGREKESGTEWEKWEVSKWGQGYEYEWEVSKGRVSEN